MTATSVPTDAVRFRNFDAEMAEVHGDPITFQLDGHIFHCVNPVPVGAMVVMLRQSQMLDDLTKNTKMINLVWSWIEPSEHDRFDEAMAKQSDPKVFEKLVEYITTEAAARPTPAS